MAATPGAAESGSAVRTISRETAQQVRASDGVAGRVVRPVRGSKPYIVSPMAFNDAQEVADHYKADQPVIVNLQGVERDLSRRIIDFASGLCYGLGGQMEKVAHQVYLLTPDNVVVTDEERQRISEGDLYQ